MAENSNVVILEIENMTPDMERDVTVQFFSVDGTALGIHYYYINSLDNSDQTRKYGISDP